MLQKVQNSLNKTFKNHEVAFVPEEGGGGGERSLLEPVKVIHLTVDGKKVGVHLDQQEYEQLIADEGENNADKKVFKLAKERIRDYLGEGDGN